jgi:hypothetical protein
MNQNQEPQYGAGTELEKIFSRLNIPTTGKCGCKRLKRRMDNKGTEWCEHNIKYIVRRIHRNAKTMRLPFNRFIVTQLVKMAIRKAKKKENIHDTPNGPHDKIQK